MFRLETSRWEMLTLAERNSLSRSDVLRPARKIREKGLVSTVCACMHISGIPDKTVLLSCTRHQVRVILIVHCCVRGLDSAVLHAFLWLRGEPTALNTKRKRLWSIYAGCLWVLANYNLCFEVVAYICGVKMVLRRQRSSSDKRWCH